MFFFSLRESLNSSLTESGVGHIFVWSADNKQPRGLVKLQYVTHRNITESGTQKTYLGGTIRK